MLGLNEDLIEAVALGHDLGHAPFGHDGEAYLSEIGRVHGLGPFVHSVQSVRALDLLENKGRGLNLSLQVLDGILCHDGEADLMSLTPDRDKDFARLDQETAQKGQDPSQPLRPMTLEGCVVRLADTIAYIGRDLEDAIRLELVKREEIPARAAKVLGTTNGTIVYRLVEDLLARSREKDRVGYSDQVAEALLELKNFSRERIYSNPQIKVHASKIRNLFNFLFDLYLTEVSGGRYSKSYQQRVFKGHGRILHRGRPAGPQGQGLHGRHDRQILPGPVPPVPVARVDFVKLFSVEEKLTEKCKYHLDTKNVGG